MVFEVETLAKLLGWSVAVLWMVGAVACTPSSVVGPPCSPEAEQRLRAAGVAQEVVAKACDPAGPSKDQTTKAAPPEQSSQVSRVDAATNAALLASVPGGPQVWDYRELWRWRSVAAGLETYALNPESCPAVESDARLANPGDEFAAQDRKREVVKCFDKIKQGRQALPKLVAIETPVIDAIYSFDSKTYLLRLEHSRVLDNTDDLMIRRTERCQFRWVYQDCFGPEDACPVLLVGANLARPKTERFSANGGESAVAVAADESEARWFKSRLEAREVQVNDTLRVQVAVVPEEFRSGDVRAKVGEEYVPVLGLKSRAVAFRVVDGSVPLTTWAPFGKGADGKAAPAPVLRRPGRQQGGSR